MQRRTGQFLLTATLLGLCLAWVGWGLAPAGAATRGAHGLDARAGATAKTCRALAATWRRSGAVPDEVEILGRARPVIDLAGQGVRPGKDVRAPLQRAFDAAATAADPAPVFFLPPSGSGTPYLRSGRVTLAVPGAELCGYGAHILASDERNIGLGLQADGTGLYGLTFEAPRQAQSGWADIWARSRGAEPPKKFPSAGKRFGTWASHIILLGAGDVVMRDLTLLGARRGGVRFFSADNVLVEGVCVYRPHSDGIHIVNGSRNVTVRRSTVIESGDDCISVVTYDRDKQPRTVSSILIENNICAGSRTRGLTVIGGEDVTITGNEIRDTLMAGILLFPAPRHNTYPVRNVVVSGNRLDGTGLRRDRCSNCGDIVANDPGRMIENVDIRDNDITKRPAGSPIRRGAVCAPPVE